MKTLKQIITLAAITLTTAWFASCNNGSTTSAAPVLAPTYYQNCLNCGGITNGTAFYTSTSTDFSNLLLLNLRFSGSNAAASSYYGAYGSPIITYQGPVVANGSLSVNLGMNSMGCVIPAGTYSLSTIQAGTWASSIVQGLRMQANGPAQMVVSISTAQVSAKPYGEQSALWSEIPQQGGLFGDLIIESVNGYQCYRDILVN